MNTGEQTDEWGEEEDIRASRGKEKRAKKRLRKWKKRGGTEDDRRAAEERTQKVN